MSSRSLPGLRTAPVLTPAVYPPAPLRLRALGSSHLTRWKQRLRKVPALMLVSREWGLAHRGRRWRAEGIEGRKHPHEGREITKWVMADHCPGVPEGMFLVGTEEARREPWEQAEQGGVHPAWGLGCSGDPGELALVSSTFQWGPLTCRWVHPCFLDAVSPGHCLRGNICPLGSSGPRLALGGQGQASQGPQLSLWEPPVPAPPTAHPGRGGCPHCGWATHQGPGVQGMLVGPGESQVMGKGKTRCGGFPGSSWDRSQGRLLQKAGSRARELRAVLGPGPE